jgi:aminopeptidase
MFNRINKLAKNLVNYSCEIKPGEKVLISIEGESTICLAQQIIKEVYAADGYPYIELSNSRLTRQILLGSTDNQIELLNDISLYKMKKMDAYIAVRGNDNTAELSDVPNDKMRQYSKIMKPTLDQRVNKTKWVVLRYPNNSMAQKANMSLEAFENYYFNVCNLDYSKMDKALNALNTLMDQTNKVRISGPNTDLNFSIKDIPSVKCSGKMNIPDGEIFTAPVKNSVNGTLMYNTPSEYHGFTFDNIYFEFKEGKIISAKCNDDKRINHVLDTDEGARYIGEFSLGINPYILSPMMDTLFDEKIAGSFHFTPGSAYIGEADNGNRSAVHWDLVCIQRAEYGGGQIYFDDILIRDNGIFVLDELQCLNPENLK